MRRVLSRVLGLLVVLLVVTHSGFATGRQEQGSAPGGGEAYLFSNVSPWDLAQGRKSVDEQKKDPYLQHVAAKVGAAPLTVSWEWEGAEGYLRGLRLMLASGELPEALYPYDMKLTMELIEEGVAVPLDDLLKEHGQNILADFSKEEWDKVRSLSPDGKIYFVPDANPVDRIETPFVRQDWLDRLGLAIPQTRDELLRMYRTFKTHDANGNGDPNDEIPISGRQGMRWCDDLFMMHGVSMFEGFPQWRWDPQAGRLISDQVSQEMRNSIEFLRTLYKEGLMDPVMPIQSYADWLAKITGDRLGHFLHFPANLTRFSDFMLNNPGQKGWSYLPLVQVPGLPRQKIMFMRMGVPGLMITRAAKRPEKIIQWFNWGRTEEASLYKQLGIPGLDWKREDGKITVLRTEQKPRYWSYIHVGVKYVPEATGMTEYGDMKVRATEQVKNDIYFGPDNLYMPLSVYEGYEDYDPTVTKLYREWGSKMVTGELDMSAWDEYVKTWQRNGGEVVTARANEWYMQTRR